MKAQGMTLIEVLVCIVIIGLLTSLALYSFSNILKRSQANNTMSTLVHLCRDARAAAITQRQRVIICGSSNLTSCDNNWSSSVLVFIDNNNNNTFDSTDKILRVATLKLNNATLTWSSFSGNLLAFETIGLSYASNGTFTYCPSSKEAIFARQVIINRGGRVRQSYDANNDGIHEDSSGQPLNCT